MKIKRDGLIHNLGKIGFKINPMIDILSWEHQPSFGFKLSDVTLATVILLILCAIPTMITVTIVSVIFGVFLKVKMVYLSWLIVLMVYISSPREINLDFQFKEENTD